MHVIAEARAAPRIRPEQPAKHADECGLPTAVGTEKAADFARADLKVHIVYDCAVVKPFGHSGYINDKIVGHGSETELYIHRLARMKVCSRLRVENRLDHENQLAAGFLL